jgi:hypothetical protein
MKRLCMLVAIVGGVGCANDPQYVPSPTNIEAGMDDGMGGITQGSGSIHVPIKPESMDDAKLRMQIQQEVDPTGAIVVPTYRIDEYDLSVEWTVKNLDGMPGQFEIELNGANEMFSYDPSLIVLDPGDDEAPPMPGLAGDIPIDIPANGEVSGTFREDQLLEAAIDLDQISRGNVNPFAATLTVSKNAESFQPLTPLMPGVMDYMQMPMGPAIPRAAFRQLVRVDLVFKPNRHMVMDYVLRVRPHRDVINDMGLDAPAGEIMIIDPAPFVP